MQSTASEPSAERRARNAHDPHFQRSSIRRDTVEVRHRRLRLLGSLELQPNRYGVLARRAGIGCLENGSTALENRLKGCRKAGKGVDG